LRADSSFSIQGNNAHQVNEIFLKEPGNEDKALIAETLRLIDLDKIYQVCNLENQSAELDAEQV
jgi:hypothetical protein